MTISKTKRLIIFGLGDLAKIACEYFTNDSKYEVLAFAIDEGYIPESKNFCGLPVLPFNSLKINFPSHDIKYESENINLNYQAPEIFVAMVYNNMNRDRASVCERVKHRKYKLATYISSHAFVSPNASIGENCFIFENNVIQTGTTIEDNCILWSGNHIGHHSTIKKDCFISSHVVVSGHCTIESNCFIGVNSTMANNTTIGHDTWVSHGSIMSGNIPPHSMVKPVTGNTEVTPLNERALSRSLERNKR